MAEKMKTAEQKKQELMEFVFYLHDKQNVGDGSIIL